MVDETALSLLRTKLLDLYYSLFAYNSHIPSPLFSSIVCKHVFLYWPPYYTNVTSRSSFTSQVSCHPCPCYHHTPLLKRISQDYQLCLTGKSLSLECSIFGLVYFNFATFTCFIYRWSRSKAPAVFPVFSFYRCLRDMEFIFVSFRSPQTPIWLQKLTRLGYSVPSIAVITTSEIILTMFPATEFFQTRQ